MEQAITWPLVGTTERRDAPRKVCAESAAAIVTDVCIQTSSECS